MKKLMKMIIGERAKQARHSLVCSIENRGYIIIIGRAKRAPHWGVQSRFRVIYNWRASEASETLSGLFN